MMTDNQPPVAKTLTRQEFGLWLLDKAMYDAKTLYLVWRCGRCGMTAFEFEERCTTCQAERFIN
jgi:hypothetical protein